jgi:hypothetical protein
MAHDAVQFIDAYWHIFALITGLLLFHAYRWDANGSRKRAALREFAFVWAMALAYFLIRGMMLNQEELAFANAHDLIYLERELGIFREAAMQDAVVGNAWAMRFWNFVYVWWHWPLIVIVLVWLFLCHPQHYPVYRNAFLISGAIGLAIFALYPVAPPRFLPELGFADTVPKRAIFNNILLPPSLTNTFAAMPSLHAGWNLLIGIALVRHGTRWATRAFGVLMPLMMFISIVVTGNHYIIDGLAGDAIAEAGLLIALGLSRSRGEAQDRADLSLAPS